MKVLAIIGSPRARGNTYRFVRMIEERLRQQADVEFEYLQLGEADLRPCKGCAVCLVRGEDHCPLADDLAEIERRLLAADGVILACPVYAMDMPSVMRVFMERLAYSMHRPRFFDQKALLVTTTGVAGTRETLGRLAEMSYAGMQIVGKVGVPTPSGAATAAECRAISAAADRGAAMLHKALGSQGYPPPTLFRLIIFRMQQLTFSLTAEEWPADHAYYREKGWVDPECRFYVDAPVNPIKALIARGLQSLMRGRALRDMQERRSERARRWWGEHDANSEG